MSKWSPKLTSTVLAKEYADWRRDTKTQLRFGQTIVNKYLEDGRAPEIFYSTDINFILCSLIGELPE